ncbi:MAG: acyl-CoA thioesterase [Bacteroidaceae bacterium]|nr:acyl-CoA thioesterase [Bacteroidaceae bacterium]
MNEYIHKVKYYECDRMGITHHSNYIRFMEEARVDFLDRIGYGFEKIEADGVVSPVIDVKCQYKKSTTFQDEIKIEVKLSEVKALKFTFSYIGRKGDDIIFTGESTHCFMENGKPVKLKERYPGLFDAE